MTPHSIRLLTICGISELPDHAPRAVTHVLTILDPDTPDPEAFSAYDRHHRTVLRFHDVIEPLPGCELPRPEHVEAILRFGEELSGAPKEAEGHLLVHCHMGISRSTAAMATLLAQSHPDEPEDLIFERIRAVRPIAWPNSVMIGFADGMLGRGGRLLEALRRHYGVQVKANPRFAEEMRRLHRGREVDMAA